MTARQGLTAATAIGLLALASGCGSLATTGAGQAAGAPTCSQQRTLADLSVSMTAAPCPARAGKETILVTVLDAAGQPVAPQRVTVRYWMQGMDMPGLPRDVQLTGSGSRYEGSLPLGMSGKWHLQVRIDRGSDAPVTSDFTVPIT